MKSSFTLLFVCGCLVLTAMATPSPRFAIQVPAPASPIESGLANASPALAAQIDSIPSGDHEVKSYRNGVVSEVVVTDGKITKMVIDGETIAAADYGQHRGTAERLLGTSEMNITVNMGNLDGLTEALRDGSPDREKALAEFEQRMEAYGDYMEQRMEALRVRLSELNASGDLDVTVDLSNLEDITSLVDSIMVKTYKAVEVATDRKPFVIDDATIANNVKRKLTFLEEAKNTLETEGLLEPTDKLRRIKISYDEIRINGKKLVPAADRRFRELLKERDLNMGNKPGSTVEFNLE